MRFSSGFAIAAALSWSACAGVSPRPDEVAPDALPSPRLAAGDVVRRDALVARCVGAAVTRRFEEAERDARAALAIDPRCARARAVVGMALLEQARGSEPLDLPMVNRGDAETLLAERLAPADPFVGWMRAMFLAGTGHFSAAAAAAEAALVRAAGAPPEERAPLLGVAGTWRYELGEERAALPLLQAYLDIRGDDAAAHFRAGSCLLRIAAVRRGTRDATQSAQIQNAQRDAERAARAFQRCFDLAPGDEDAALAIGAATLRAAELAAERGDLAQRDQRLGEAAVQFASAAARFPQSAEARFRVGFAAEARGAPAEAQAAYEQALELDPGHLGALLDLAALLDGGPDASRVAPLLQRALAADAKRPGLTAAERRRLRERVQAGGG